MLLGNWLLVALGIGLYWLAVLREDRIRDLSALRIAWMTFAGALALGGLDDFLKSGLIEAAAWGMIAISVAFLFFAVYPLIPPETERVEEKERKTSPGSVYQPVMPPLDDTSHIPVPPEVPQI